ncbi:MAG: autotransporter domain-containing protein [Pseudomonadota bacterium]
MAGTPTTTTPAHPFDVWAEGKYTQFKIIGGSGDFFVLHSGIDYLITPRTLIGFGGQLDWANFKGAPTGAAAVGGTAKGRGFLVGPYVTAKPLEHFYVEARASWGHSSNTVSPYGTYKDGFGAERWLGTLALIGEFNLGVLSIKP